MCVGVLQVWTCGRGAPPRLWCMEGESVKRCTVRQRECRRELVRIGHHRKESHQVAPAVRKGRGDRPS